MRTVVIEIKRKNSHTSRNYALKCYHFKKQTVSQKFFPQNYLTSTIYRSAFWGKKTILIWFCTADSRQQNIATFLQNYFSLPGKSDFLTDCSKILTYDTKFQINWKQSSFKKKKSHEPFWCKKMWNKIVRFFKK